MSAEERCAFPGCGLRRAYSGHKAPHDKHDSFDHPFVPLAPAPTVADGADGADEADVIAERWLAMDPHDVPMGGAIGRVFGAAREAFADGRRAGIAEGAQNMQERACLLAEGVAAANDAKRGYYGEDAATADIVADAILRLPLDPAKKEDG